MMDVSRQILSTLRDVSGVHGSFVVTRDGALFARDMSDMFTNDLLAEVAPRVVRIGDTFSSDGAEVMSCVARYAEHALFLRAMAGGTLCVLMAPDVNLPALKMGANLAVRRLAPLLERPVQEAPPPPAAAAPAPVATHAQPSAPGRRWRGATVPSSGEGQS